MEIRRLPFLLTLLIAACDADAPDAPDVASADVPSDPSRDASSTAPEVSADVVDDAVDDVHAPDPEPTCADVHCPADSVCDQLACWPVGDPCDARVPTSGWRVVSVAIEGDQHQRHGLDLDGDGTIDNNLGAAVVALDNLFGTHSPVVLVDDFATHGYPVLGVTAPGELSGWLTSGPQVDLHYRLGRTGFHPGTGVPLIRLAMTATRPHDPRGDTFDLSFPLLGARIVVPMFGVRLAGTLTPGQPAQVILGAVVSVHAVRRALNELASTCPCLPAPFVDGEGHAADDVQCEPQTPCDYVAVWGRALLQVLVADVQLDGAEDGISIGLALDVEPVLLDGVEGCK